MRFLRFVLGRSGRARLLLAAAALVGAAAGGASVGLLALIHRTLEAGAPGAGFLLVFAGLCLLVTGGRVGSQYLLARLGQGMVLDLRLELSRQILGTSLSHLERLGAHRLLATLTDDINTLSQALLTVPAIGVNGVIVVGCLAYLGWLDVRLFLLLVGGIVLGVLTYLVSARAGLDRLRRSREQEDVLFGHFRGLVEGVKELKLHRPRRISFVGDLHGAAERMRGLRVAASLIYSAAASWGNLFFFLVLGLLLYTGPALLGVEAGVLTGYVLVLLYMMPSLQGVLDSLPVLSRADVAVEKVRRLGFSLALEEPGDSGLAAGSPSWRRLELDGVTCSYRREGSEGRFTLGPLDLALEPGEVVFVVGGNGSGKTTLAKLLVGLYPPEEGEVRLDGRPVEGWEAYRQLFTAVFVDFYLFERLLGLDSPGVDDRARRYLEELRLAHAVEITDGKWSRTALSQGQRKRLALLTAYLEDRPIYVFDEWAADQDPEFKEVFYRHILGELKRRGKAVVVITHDDRYFHLADRILKLEDGRLRYEGNPEGLALGVAAPGGENP